MGFAPESSNLHGIMGELMSEFSDDSRTLFFRMLQGAAVAFALVLGAAYVWWAQHKAEMKIERAAQPAVPALISGPGQDAPTTTLAVGPPLHSPDALIVSSKSISNPIFTSRKVDDDAAISGEEHPAPEYSSASLAASSKSPQISPLPHDPERMLSAMIHFPIVDPRQFQQAEVQAAQAAGIQSPPRFTPDNLVFSSKSGSVDIGIASQTVPFPQSQAGTVQPSSLAASSNPQISYGGVGTNITANFCGRFIDSPPLFPL